MKVVLTAFQGKLRSEPMDWPEGTCGEIRMRLDLPHPKWNMDFDPTQMLTEHLCIFEETGHWFPIPGNPRGAAEFRLVGLR